MPKISIKLKHLHTDNSAHQQIQNEPTFGKYVYAKFDLRKIPAANFPTESVKPDLSTECQITRKLRVVNQLMLDPFIPTTFT